MCTFRTAVYQSNQILQKCDQICLLFSGQKSNFILPCMTCLPFRPFRWPTLTFPLIYTTTVHSQAQFLLFLPPFSDPLRRSLRLYPEDTRSTAVCLTHYMESHHRTCLSLSNHCCYSVLYVTQLKNCPSIQSIT